MNFQKVTSFSNFVYVVYASIAERNSSILNKLPFLIILEGYLKLMQKCVWIYCYYWYSLNSFFREMLRATRWWVSLRCLFWRQTVCPGTSCMTFFGCPYMIYLCKIASSCLNQDPRDTPAKEKHAHLSLTEYYQDQAHLIVSMGLILLFWLLLDFS